MYVVGYVHTHTNRHAHTDTHRHELFSVFLRVYVDFSLSTFSTLLYSIYSRKITEDIPAINVVHMYRFLLLVYLKESVTLKQELHECYVEYKCICNVMF